MTISVLVNGAFGRMGQLTAKVIDEDERFKLVGQTGREYDLKKAIADSQADVVIDFTHPTSVYQNLKTIIEAKAHPVIGTSGLTQPEIKKMQALSHDLQLGGIIAPNFSLGAVLLMKHAREIVKYMPNVEIIELHHDAKLDSPSGTSIRTAELLSENRKKLPEKKSHETVTGARGGRHLGIPIHAIRLPGLLAHEEVIFGSAGETLRISHDAIDRVCFMPGIKLACEKVMDLKELVYGLEDIL